MFLDEYSLSLFDSPEKLESYKAEIDEFLKTIKLELHPQKSKAVPLQKGVKLLGFCVFYKYELPKKGNVRRIRQRVCHFVDLYKDGIIVDKPAIFESVASKMVLIDT